MIAATAIGIGVNAVRSNPVKLIQNTQAVSTASHDEEAAPAVSDGGMPEAEALPEGAVAVDELKQLLDEGAIVLIDARSPSAFEEKRIPGAINIPYDQLPSYLEALEESVLREDHVVCYCWSPTCDFSDQLATELKIMGYENVSVFTGGMEHWAEAGHPTEGTETE
jgi:rhodanese-related sulfurtransferase